MKKKFSKISTYILILFLLVGLSVMIYPSFSDWWNARTQTRAISSYQNKVAEMDDGEIEKMLERAREYNTALAKLDFPLIDYAKIEGYDEILDVAGTGVMGYVSIPQIRVELPVYHGTSEGVLNIAVGHLQGSTLPVGGEGTHAVISAHRGLISAKLFSDLDQLIVGDEFTITVLNEVYTYEVDKISIVLPSETKKLNISDGQDYVTLMTCTPYGINSHRLLVRGHRVETVENGDIVRNKVTADAVQIESLVVVPFIAIPLFIALLVYWFVSGNKKKFPHKNPLLVLKNKDDDKNKKGG